MGFVLYKAVARAVCVDQAGGVAIGFGFILAHGGKPGALVFFVALGAVAAGYVVG
jgi:hypothetical protein